MSELIHNARITEQEKIQPKELQEFMNYHGISNKEFSEIFGVTESAVSLWLNGKREMSITNSRLIRLFDSYPQLIREF